MKKLEKTTQRKIKKKYENDNNMMKNKNKNINNKINVCSENK